jgi:hypothetical protein
VTLDVNAARAGIAEQVAKPLGLSLEDAAEGVVQLFEDHLQNSSPSSASRRPAVITAWSG